MRLQSNVSWGSSRLRALPRLEDPVAREGRSPGCSLEVFLTQQHLLGLFTAWQQISPRVKDPREKDRSHSVFYAYSWK